MKRKLAVLFIFILTLNSIIAPCPVRVLADDIIDNASVEEIGNINGAEAEDSGIVESEETGETAEIKEVESAGGELPPDVVRLTVPTVPVSGEAEASGEAVVNVVENTEALPVIEEKSENSRTSEESSITENDVPASENTVSEGSLSKNDVIRTTVVVSDDDIREGAIPLKKAADEIVSMTLPIFSDEDNIYDYILDPYGLINKTEAARYGGQKFQEDATLYFKNSPDRSEADENGEEADAQEISFSDTSDFRTVTNKSNVPVDVSVILRFSNEGDIRVSEEPDFGELDVPAVYFAIVDREGTSVSVNLEGEARYTRRLEAVPEDTYIYEYDEEEARYRLKTDFEDVEFDSFDFAVRGAANPNSDWGTVTQIPPLEIIWSAEPVHEDKEDTEEEDEKDEQDEQKADEEIEAASEPVQEIESGDSGSENKVDAVNNGENGQENPEITEGSGTDQAAAENTGDGLSEITPVVGEAAAETVPAADGTAVESAPAADDAAKGIQENEEEKQENNEEMLKAEASSEEKEEKPEEEYNTVKEKDEDDEKTGKTGTGRFEGMADKDIFSARLPVETEGKFSYIIDPDMMITRTNGAAYPGETFEKGQTLYFTNKAVNAKYDHSSASDPVTIVNKGTVPLKITVSAALAVSGNVRLSDSPDFKSDPYSHLYFEIIDPNDEVISTQNISENYIEACTELEGVDIEDYKLEWSEENGNYVYVLPDDLDPVEIPRFSFRIRGCSNPDANWSAVKRSIPDIQVIWYIEPVIQQAEAVSGNTISSNIAEEEYYAENSEGYDE